MSFKFLCPIFTELSKDSTKLSLVVMLCVDIIILMFFIWRLSILGTFMACQGSAMAIHEDVLTL